MILLSNNQWKRDANLPVWEKNGFDCSAEARSKGLIRAYTEIAPDVMAWQEASVKMSELVMNGLRTAFPDKKYELITGGDTPIVYSRARFCLLESGFFLYPEEFPGHPGSFNNSETKSYCYGVFRERETGKTFALASTHLWWKATVDQPYSNEARAWQLTLADAKLERIYETYRCPLILMGDLNASVSSRCLETAFSLGWKEAHDVCIGEKDETMGHHFCCNTGFSRPDNRDFSFAIDHILLKHADACIVNRFARLTDEWFDPISDHYPLYIDFTLENET